MFLWFQSWDLKHDYANSDTISCKQHVHSRLAIHSMICYSANFSARNLLNEQSQKIKCPLGFQRKMLS